MLFLRIRSIIALSAVFLLYTCIDPYTPVLKNYESILVVDGLLTDESTACTIRLTRTFKDMNAVPEPVSGASVYISDEDGTEAGLNEVRAGIYKADSTLFRGEAGKTYALHIRTADGKEYESDKCLMEAVAGIDSIYYEKKQEIVNNGTENLYGIMIYMDSEPGTNKYYRWSYEEDWKFLVHNPKKMDYINEKTFVPVKEVKDFCWKNYKSDEVLIRSALSTDQDAITKEPIKFIISSKSDRLTFLYSINVKQLSISGKEFAFWSDLQKVNESGSDIFASQPFSITGNVHNLNDPAERVLGYFQVSAVKQKRIVLQLDELVKLNLPPFDDGCKRIEMAPEDYPHSGFGPPLTWDDLYQMYCITSDWYFVEPKFISGTRTLQKLVFSRPECADCELTGSRAEPDFMTEKN
jgi:hypothetical protein